MEDAITKKYDFSDFASDMIRNNLISAMERHNMTKGALSQKTGLSWRTIQNWYCGACDPSIVKILLLCHMTGWDLSEIIGGILDGP